MVGIGAARGSVQPITGGAGANRKKVIGGRPIARHLALSSLASVPAFTPRRAAASVLYTGPKLLKTNIKRWRKASDRAGLR